MAWQLVGAVTVTPATLEAEVGPLAVPTIGGVELKLRQRLPVPFQWRHVLLSYRSQNGLELGTVKAWPRPEFSNVLLGAGLQVADNVGVLVFEPGRWNLRQVAAGFPLTVELLADVESELPADRYLADEFSTAGGQSIPLTLSGSLGRLEFSR
jgi:hypothetical protein